MTEELKDQKSTEKKKSLIERLDSVADPLPDNSLHNFIEDALAVSAQISKGTEPKITSKEIAAGTLEVINGVKKVIKK